MQHLAATANACVPGLQLHMLAGCEGDARLGSEELCCEDELFLPILSERYVVALPETHPVPRSEWASAHHLGHGPWIMCPTHASHQRLMPLYSVAASGPAAHASNFSLALDLVVAGVGMAVVPESLADETPGALTHPLETMDLKRRIGLCYSGQSRENNPLTILRNALDAD